MKKFIFITTCLLLIAAGCNRKSSEQSNNTPSSTSTPQTQNQPANNSSSTLSDVRNAPNGRVYTNHEYNFQFQLPEKVVIVDGTTVFDYNGDTDRANSPGVGVQVTKYESLPKTIADACKDAGDSNLNCKGLRSVTQEEYGLLKEAISDENTKYIQQFTQNLQQETSFVNNGLLIIFQSPQAPGYQMEFDIFDKNNNLIKVFALGTPKDSMNIAKKSQEYQILKTIAESFNFSAK